MVRKEANPSTTKNKALCHFKENNQMKKLLATLISVALCFLGSCDGKQEPQTLSPTEGGAIAKDNAAMAQEQTPDFSSLQVEDPSIKVESIPEDVTWYTSHPGVFGSSRAKQGGTFTNYMAEFPQTFRTVGPNSNGSHRIYLNTSGSLVNINNETKEWMPFLATHWAFGSDGASAYYKLNPNARWNDGEPITSKDYIFMIEMMRSENIQAPWYNDYYTQQIIDLRAYDEYTISVHTNVPKAPDDLLYATSVSPRPSHHYGGEISETWVDDFQWVYEPTAGAYYLSEFEKGEFIRFEKVDDWWGYEYDYNRYRFNVQTIHLKVITGGRDIVKNYFYRGELDSFALIIPQEWEDATNEKSVISGYIDRQNYYYVPLTGLSGIFLNLQHPLFQSKDVRTGLYYAINMQKMIDTVLRGQYARYHNIGLAHEFGGYEFDDNTIRVPDFNPLIAKEHFERAGYKETGSDGIRIAADGSRLSFELIYSAQHHTERLSILKEEAKKAGLEIILNLMQEGLFTTVLEKQHQAFWGGMSTGIYPSYWEYFHSSNAEKTNTNNFFAYASPEMDKLVDAAREESDLGKKAEIIKEIQRLVHEEAILIPNYYVPYYRGASWKWLRFPAWLSQKYNDSFYFPMLSDGYSGYFWIDESIREEVMDSMQNNISYEPTIILNEKYKTP